MRLTDIITQLFFLYYILFIDILVIMVEKNTPGPTKSGICSGVPLRCFGAVLLGH